MKKLRRFGRSLLDMRSRPAAAKSPVGRAARLARLAGGATGGSGLEQLETRQLLFTLSIGPGDIDPQTGLGTVTRDFSYVIPTLVGPVATQTQPTIVDENFDDEMAAWTNQIPATPPSGTFFEQSNIQISYSSVGQNPVQAITRAGQPVDRALWTRLQSSDQVTFAFFQPQQQQGNPLPRVTTAASVTISGNTFPLPGDGGGLNTSASNGTRIELLLDGNVVATYSGAQLDAIAQAVNGGTRFDLSYGPGFDSFRFRSAVDGNGSYSDTFVVERIQTALPGGQYAQDIGNRTYDARVAISGPVGTSVQILDLYGRDMVLRDCLVPAAGSMFSPIDRNDDGVPDFNDGIGKILLSGGNANASFTIAGYKCVPSTTGDPKVFPSPVGFFDAFEQAGFGYYRPFVPPGTPPIVRGLPPGQGSVIVGSPFVRDNSSATNYIQPIQTPSAADFSRTDQGVFVTDGSTFGSVLVHGLLHGSSSFNGALGRLSVGAMLGSARIEGDLELFSSASDAGMYAGEEAGPGIQPGQFVPTVSRLSVGRTLREIAIAGRNAMNISVLADVNNASRARLQMRDYYSHERAFGFDPATQNGDVRTLKDMIAAGSDWSGRFNGAAQPIPFGDDWFRNDSLGSAEYIGYNGTSVRVHGQLNGRDTVNAAADSTDVFAFPADSSREVLISAAGSLDLTSGYLRVVDRNGRVVAALDLGGAGRGQGGTGASSSRILRFRPDHADTYYLVLNIRPNNTGNDFAPAQGTYEITVAGMAPVTLGALRIASGAGSQTGGNYVAPFSTTLSAGSMGAIRIGTGYINGTQAEQSTAGIINNTLPINRMLRWGSSNFSIPGNLYSASAGTDIDGVQLIVGGELGTVIVGNSDGFGRSVLNGDIINLDLRVGGRISILDVKGALASDQDPEPFDSLSGSVSIHTGTAPGKRGDIGQFLIGAYVNGAGLSVTTSPGSQIDQFLVGNDNGGAGSQYPGQIRGTPTFTLGTDSDIRFVDFSQISRTGDPNVTVTITYGQSITLVDDAGGTVVISITGGQGVPPGSVPGTPAPTDGSSAVIRLLPINGSRGVAISRIIATLRGGANLTVNGTAAGVVSIGRLIVDSDFGTAGGSTPTTPFTPSSIFLTGVAEIDVGRIDQVAGTLQTIENRTQGGDLLAIDANSLKNILITAGNLGRTQTTAFGPSLIGPELGLAPRGAGQVFDPLQITPASINIPGTEGDDWDGSIFTPVTVNNYEAPSPLEDIGSPLHPDLNGVVVRTGDLFSVNVAGTVGDVIVQSGHLINLVANSDGITPQGGFQGIEGTIYALAIGTIDIGDGLRGTGVSPFAAAGIFADNAILNVNGTRVNGARIEGVIISASGAFINAIGTEQPTNLAAPATGIGTVTLNNGRYDGAYIHAGALDDFWRSTRVRDNGVLAGPITSVRGTNSDLFRSEIGATSVNDITLTGGAWDASSLTVISLDGQAGSGSIGTIIADEFRNSTRLGEPGEVFLSRITATNNLANISTTGNLKDIADLTLDLGGSLTGAMSARNLVRVNVQIDNVTNSLIATNDIRSSSVVSGSLRSMTAGKSIRSTSLSIAGPIQTVTAGDEITQLDAISTGPDGRIDLVRATNRLDADISSSGAIGTVESVNSDITGTIVTRNDPLRANNGGLTTLRAGRDIIVELSILGDTQTIFAGRNIGAQNILNPDLDLRGNLANITAQTGQIYSDLIVGQSITGVVRNGRVNMRPGQDKVATASILVFGRINALDLNGDFNGDITSRSGGIGNITISNGSFRPGHSITVNNGDLTQLTLNGGDLLGNVFVDGNIGRIDVLVGADGFKGQIGIASWRRNTKRWKDDIRNELPPGVQRTAAVDGVTIKAGGSIGAINVQQGSFTESQVIAGTTIDSVYIGLQLRNDSLTKGLNNAIVAADRVSSVVVGAFTGAVAVLGGVQSLGDDGRVGGTGADADIVGPGSIGDVRFNGKKVVNSIVAAGISPNASGLYNTPSSLAAPGISSVGSVFGNIVKNTSAFADGPLGSTSAGIVRGGSGLAQVYPDRIASATQTPTEIELAKGVALAFTTLNGERGTATFNGAGRAFWDPAQNRLRLLNTDGSSSLNVASVDGAFTDLLVRGNTNASLGTLNIGGTLRGASSAYMDAGITTAAFGVVDATGIFGSGGDISTLSFTRMLTGQLTARAVNTFTVNGDFGRNNVSGDASAEFFSVTSINVTGAIAGAISVEQGIPTLNAGSVDHGGVRSGLSIGTAVIGSLNTARISARSSINSLTVNGNAVGAAIYGGTDLGRDADFGGSGFDADVSGSGSINNVRINGNFTKSDVAAGVSRGPSGYVGNADAVNAAGRSSIGNVVITGTQVGSTINSEQFRVISNGTVGSVMVGGQDFTGSGNFRVERLQTVASPVRVLDLTVTEDSRIFTAVIKFNQAIDSSTLSNALSVVELRNGGATVIGLAEGTDYTVSYDRFRSEAYITFSRSVTERNLPQVPGVPGPGVYQIILSAQVLRGSTQDSLLDGNADGLPGDDFVRNTVVGDAGDKINPGNPASAPSIDFYGAVDLNLVLRTNGTVGSLPDVNTPFILSGSIGDHPDTDSDFFRAGGDVDVYRVSLRAGQILRLSENTGVGLGVQRSLYDASGNPVSGAQSTTLPSAAAAAPGATAPQQYLIRQTGTYYLVVSGDSSADISDVNDVLNIDPVPGAFGRYSFGITVFDDQNTGFAGDTGSGTGAPIVNAPEPIVFAGPDGTFNTPDDISKYVIGDWTFTLKKGTTRPDGPDAVVSGTNSLGWVSTRTAAPNGTFGSANDRLFTSINSSIGLPGSSGVPSEVSPDMDVFRLNNGQAIAPGTRIRATFRLTALGSNIGLALESSDPDPRGRVGIAADLIANTQFGIFELPAGTGFDNARLVAAPSDFLPIGGQPQSEVADGGNRYGYDANGDFFIEFVVPGAQGVAGAVPAVYAIAVQGAVRSDYSLEILTQGTRAITNTPQNVFIESLGGTIDWLEAGEGITTSIAPFNTSIVGFSGLINGQDVNTYVLQSLVTRLNEVFTAAGVRLNISTDPSNFQGQNFSTVFLGGNAEPSVFFGNGQYGASEHVDAFNADKNDEAVVFVSALADLGFENTQAGVDQFVQALTAAVGRRIGELLGLRMETSTSTAATPIPIMSADSVQQFAAGNFRFVSTDRALAGAGDNIVNTDFFLGFQNSGYLIAKNVTSL